MTEFSGVSIVTGAVTETDSLRRTVEFILENCNHNDLTEIIIGYPDRATSECVAVIKELEAKKGDVRVWSFVQKRPSLGFLTEAFDFAAKSKIVFNAFEIGESWLIVLEPEASAFNLISFDSALALPTLCTSLISQSLLLVLATRVRISTVAESSEI